MQTAIIGQAITSTTKCLLTDTAARLMIMQMTETGVGIQAVFISVIQVEPACCLGLDVIVAARLLGAIGLIGHRQTEWGALLAVVIITITTLMDT